MIDHKKLQVSDISYPIHGGNSRLMAKASGTDPEKIIDFSASINPLSPPSYLSQLFLETPGLLQQYPDPHCSIITERISNTTGVPKDWIRVTNGSTEMIYLLPHLFNENQEVAIIDPCFSEYEKSFMAFGIQTHSVPLNASENFQANPISLFSTLDMIQKLRAIVLGNPASPTGKLYGELLAPLQEYCEERDIILIVDEAFIDFTSTQNSAWNLIKKKTNLILVRSLTKFYSIPGLRVGYGILHPEKIRQIAPRQYPWSVNSLAQTVGAEVILDKPFQEKTRSWTQNERNFMFQALNTISAIQIFPSTANFLLFRILDDSKPMDLYRYLLSQSLLIRNCGNFKGLDETFFRISLKERQENQKLADSISYYFSSSKNSQE